MKSVMTLVAAALMMCCVQKAAAQESENKSAWSIKLQAGMTLATLAGDDADGVENKLCWDGGIEAEYRMNPRVGVSLGLLYTNTGCKETDNMTSVYVGDPYPVEEADQHRDISIDYINNDNDQYTFQYLAVPFIVNVYLVGGLALKLGVQPMFKVGANRTSRVWGYFRQPGNPNNEYMHYDEENKTSISKAINTMDIAIPLGLSYEWKNVFLDARYHFGLESVIKDSDTRNRYLSVNLGYRFQL